MSDARHLIPPRTNPAFVGLSYYGSPTSFCTICTIFVPQNANVLLVSTDYIRGGEIKHRFSYTNQKGLTSGQPFLQMMYFSILLHLLIVHVSYIGIFRITAVGSARGTLLSAEGTLLTTEWAVGTRLAGTSLLVHIL